MTVKFVKDLSSHGINLVKIIGDVMIGSSPTTIKPYDENKTYNTGNLVLYYNIVTNKFDLMQCVEDGVTGVYDPLKWTEFVPVISETGTIDCGEF